jgi:hypothetical protein
MSDDLPAPARSRRGFHPFARKDRIMNVQTSLNTQRSAINASERANRQREVDFARGNVRHEGGILSDEIEQLNTRYVNGEIDSDELTGAILASQTVQFP